MKKDTNTKVNPYLKEQINFIGRLEEDNGAKNYHLEDYHLENRRNNF